MKTIKIAKVPGVAREVVINDTQKLGDAIDLYTSEFGESTDGYEMRVGDSTVDRNYNPADGSKVYLVAQIKGNH
jgi:hypothetical protein